MYAVFLHQSSPRELMELVSGYLHDVAGQIFISAVDIQHVNSFVQCHLAEDANDNEPWVVQIPIPYILAIADVRKGKHAPGFLNE